MINLMLGSSGSGKSYESVVFHVLTAVRAGRRVITNLPLLLAGFDKFDPRDDGKPSFRDLIELRIKSKGPQRRDSESGEMEDVPVFGHVLDYGSTWRNAAGQGPLYVIDECHKPLPMGSTSKKVEEWYAEHRHENADVLLITQSYGKISKAIRDNVQLVYRVRKAVAFGSMNKYIRKVQDGLRGEVMNEGIRKYEKQYFCLYRSHTKGSAASEIMSADVRPFWKNWTVWGSTLCFCLVLAACASGKVKAPWSPSISSATVKPTISTVVASSAPAVLATASAATVAGHHPSQPASSAAAALPGSAAFALMPVSKSEPSPYGDKGLHMVGVVRRGTREVWTISVSQNGQYLATMTADDLVRSGYTWKPLSDCAAVVEGYGTKRAITCDTPTMGIIPPGARPTPESAK